MDNDNRTPQDPECESTASSMSFILAEELDSLAQGRSSSPSSSTSSSPEVAEVAIDSLAVMTRSQYAQVVFQDVADAYPNDTDIVCKFTLCLEPDPEVRLLHKAGDIVGIFKVPYIHPECVLCQLDVTDDDVSQGQGCITFKAAKVPKEEDFYQFQYLRPSGGGGEVRVLGASIPFQLRKPKSEELCAVHQGDSEFMMVQTSTALATGQLSDKIGSLQNEKEQLKESLTRTTTDYSKLLKLSEDLTEQLEHKAIVNIELEKSLQTSRYDFAQLKNDVAALVQDKVILEQRLQKSQDNVKALTAEKDAVVGKWRAQERENCLLREERDKLSSKLEDTKAMMAALSDSKIMANRMIAEHVDKEQKMEEEMQKLREFAGHVHKLKTISSGATAKTGESDKKSERLVSLEKRLEDLHEFVKEMDSENSEKFGSLRQDVESLKSSVASESYSTVSSVTSELEPTMLHTDFIGNQLRESEDRDVAAAAAAAKETSSAATATPTAVKMTTPTVEKPEEQNHSPRRKSVSSSSSQTPAESQPLPPSPDAPPQVAQAAAAAAPSGQLPIPILPVQTVEAMAAAARGGVRSIKQLLTSLSMEDGSDQHQEQPKEARAVATAAMTSPSSATSAPPPQASAPPATTVVVEDGNGSQVEVLLSDDGRPISVPVVPVPAVSDVTGGGDDDNNGDLSLACPICQKSFEAGNIRQLEFHVEEHMKKELVCPVCQAKYEEGMQRRYEEHVASHFQDDEDEEEQQRQTRQESSFWFLD